MPLGSPCLLPPPLASSLLARGTELTQTRSQRHHRSTCRHLALAVTLVARQRFYLHLSKLTQLQEVEEGDVSSRIVLENWGILLERYQTRRHDIFGLEGDVQAEVRCFYHREEMLVWVRPPTGDGDLYQMIAQACDKVVKLVGAMASRPRLRAKFCAAEKVAMSSAMPPKSRTFGWKDEPLVDTVPLVSRAWHRLACSERL